MRPSFYRLGLAALLLFPAPIVAQDGTKWLRREVHRGMVVTYTEALDGGGSTFGMDIVRYVYNRLGTGIPVCCEFCAGPAFIGFNLLARGICEQLVIAGFSPFRIPSCAIRTHLPRSPVLCVRAAVDVNPEAIEAARLTIAENNLHERAVAYVSDGLGRDVLRASRPNGGTVSAKPRTGTGPSTVGALKKFYKFPLIEKEGEAPGHRLYS